jgi:Ca2+-binding RTX toxin-like protein
MYGGTGNDTFLVDDASDSLYEDPGEGTDQVQATVTWTLAANIEKLTLVGATAINGTGNTGANIMTGNEANNALAGLGGQDKLYGGLGNDTLDGGLGNDQLYGGVGNDILKGGAGADVFVFNYGLSSTKNLDTITDFVTATDQIKLDDDVFKAFDASVSTTLAAGQFHAASGATSAHDADDRIIYDTSSGALYYDSDGLGGKAAIAFATLGTTTHPALSATDIVIMA